MSYIKLLAQIVGHWALWSNNDLSNKFTFASFATLNVYQAEYTKSKYEASNEFTLAALVALSGN